MTVLVDSFCSGVYVWPSFLRSVLKDWLWFQLPEGAESKTSRQFERAAGDAVPCQSHQDLFERANHRGLVLGGFKTSVFFWCLNLIQLCRTPTAASRGLKFPMSWSPVAKANID